jgi:hypothetical protein
VIADLARKAGGDAEPRFPEVLPHARNLALLAPRLAPVSPLRPLYLRPPDARLQEGARARTPP